MTLQLLKMFKYGDLFQFISHLPFNGGMLP